MKNEYMVVVAGSAIDEYYEVESWLEMGDSVLATPRGSLVGGCILNVGAVEAGYGFKTNVMEYLKEDDSDTDLLMDEMHRYNLNTDYVCFSPEVKNCKCLIMQCKGEKCIFVIEPERPGYDMRDGRIQEMLNGATYIYGMMYNMRVAFGDDCTPLKIAKEHGAKVVFDGASQYNHPLDTETVKLADVLIMNDFAYSRLSEKFGCEAKQAMFDAGAQYVCETLGSKGVNVYFPDGEVYCPSVKVEVRDTTGAGDTFIASFMYGLKEGWPVEKIAKFATTAGARACTVKGGFGGVAEVEEIMDFAKKHGVEI